MDAPRKTELNERIREELKQLKEDSHSANFDLNTALLCEWSIESIGKCFVFYLYPHLNIKSNKSAYIAGICFRM